MPNTIIQVSTQVELKTLPPSQDMTVLLLGISEIYDNRGGLYRWDAAASGADDTAFMKTIGSNVTATGRWKRVFQNVTTLPQGVLLVNGGIKTLFASSLTVAGGLGTVFKTLENTATGTAIFSEIWSETSQVLTSAATPMDVIQSGIKTMDLKQSTHFFYKANPITLALSGVVNPIVAVSAGVSVRFRVEGI